MAIMLQRYAHLVKFKSKYPLKISIVIVLRTI
jgi:hypothetical protein